MYVISELQHNVVELQQQQPGQFAAFSEHRFPAFSHKDRFSGHEMHLQLIDFSLVRMKR